MKSKMNISNSSGCNNIYIILLVLLVILAILIAIYFNQTNKIGQNTYENMENKNKINIQFDSDSVMDSTIPTIVLFYSSKCGACHEFLPDYEILREKYKDNPKYRIAIINCDNYPNFGITKFPTIRHYTNPSKKEYKTIFE
jgi:thiol-disulfide isomerase/thioredoxin